MSKKKRCPKCKKLLPFTQFYRKTVKGKKSYQSYCKQCSKKASLKYQKSHPFFEKLRKQNSKAKSRAWFVEYKKTLKCNKCGEKRWYVLDFHHTDHRNKKYAIGQMVKQRMSQKSILEEIEKCIVLCANCHREYHYEEYMKKHKFFAYNRFIN